VNLVSLKIERTNIMNKKDIRELAAMMRESGLTVLDYSGDGMSLRMERAAGAPSAATNPTIAASEHREERIEDPGVPGLFTVRSPMVGVFYAAPGADKEPYVAVGDTVHSGDTLCIVEAMKIMNEIMVERDGVITEICAQNKQVVEYGQPLFRIDTSQE